MTAYFDAFAEYTSPGDRAPMDVPLFQDERVKVALGCSAYREHGNAGGCAKSCAPSATVALDLPEEVCAWQFCGRLLSEEPDPLCEIRDLHVAPPNAEVAARRAAAATLLAVELVLSAARETWRDLGERSAERVETLLLNAASMAGRHPGTGEPYHPVTCLDMGRVAAAAARICELGDSFHRSAEEHT